MNDQARTQTKGVLLAALERNAILVSDGAWGTLLHERGLPPDECPELWNLTHRSDVLAIARGYIDAGSDIILTNSFGGSPHKLGHYGLANKARELNTSAAEISREAAGFDHLVLGSIGPTGAILMMGEVTEEELYDGFCLQAESLKQGGADGICIETMSALDEALLAVRAGRETTGLEIVCTFTFEKKPVGGYRTLMGVSPADMAAALREAGAAVIGSNCGNGIEQMIDIVREIRSVENSLPILVHANAGMPEMIDGRTVFPETPAIMASRVRDLRRAGANIIGGCCGTTPDHIRAMVNELRH